jgi:hypothetical protein
MSSGCENEEKEEVSNPFLRFHQQVWRTIGSTVDSLRRQAPGARMIGEFAVKHAVSEAQRRIQPQDKTPEASDNAGEQQS